MGTLDLSIFIKTAEKLLNTLAEMAGRVKNASELMAKFNEEVAKNAPEAFTEGSKAAKDYAENLDKVISALIETKTQLNESEKRGISAAKANAAHGKELENLKEKYKETAKAASKDASTIGEAFKSSAKDMSQMLNKMFESNRKTGIAAFFRKEFAGIKDVIKEEFGKIQGGSVNIGVDVGDALMKGIRDGIVKPSSGGKVGIGDVLHHVVMEDIDKAITKLQRSITASIKKLDLTGLLEGINEFRAKMRSKKDIQFAVDVMTWGGPEEKKLAQSQYNDKLKQLNAHQKEVETAVKNHGIDLTKEQEAMLEKIRVMQEKAQRLYEEGIGGTNIKRNIFALNTSESTIASRVNEFKQALAQEKEKHDLQVKNEKELYEIALKQDKIDETLFEVKLKRQEQFAARSVAIAKEMQSSINKLSFEEGVKGIGKKDNPFAASSKMEIDLLNTLKTIQADTKALEKDSKISFEDKIKLLEIYEQTYNKHVNMLVDLINVRVSAERDASQLLAEYDEQEKQALKDKEAAYLQSGKKIESLQDRLKKVMGDFSEKEKFEKSSKIGLLGVDTSIPKEMEQLNKLQNAIKLLNDAKSKLQESDTSKDIDYWTGRIESINHAAKKEMDILENLVYARLNADKKLKEEHAGKVEFGDAWVTPKEKKGIEKELNENLGVINKFYNDIISMVQDYNLQFTTEEQRLFDGMSHLKELATGIFDQAILGKDFEQGVESLKLLSSSVEDIYSQIRPGLQDSIEQVLEFEKAVKEIKERQARELAASDKAMLAQQKSMTREMISVIGQMEKEINKLIGESSGVGMVDKKTLVKMAKTPEELDMVKQLRQVMSSLADAAKEEDVLYETRERRIGVHVAVFKDAMSTLVGMINDRLKAEEAADKAKAMLDAEDKDRIKESASLYKSTMKEWEGYSKTLRGLTGQLTPDEAFKVSAKDREFVVSDNVKEEIEQVNKLAASIEDLKWLLGELKEEDFTSSTIISQNVKYVQSSIEEQIKSVRNLVAARKLAEKESLEDKAKGQQAQNKIEAQAKRDRKEKEREEALAARKFKKDNDDKIKAARAAAREQESLAKQNDAALRKGFNKMFSAVGLDWRNRNMVESLQRVFHGVTTFGRSVSQMASDVAKKFFYITAVITGSTAAIGAALAYGMKKIYDFGKNIVKTTEEVRGYEIALYGMMGTHRGVKEMMDMAEKITKDMPIGYKTIQESIKGLVLIGPVRDMLRNTTDLEGIMQRLFKIVVGLATIQPEWGAKGAIFSLRNALTGDLRSLQRRFELPVRNIFSKEGIPLQELQYQPEKMVETLERYISSFYSTETLQMAANQFSAIIEKIEGNWIKFLKSIGDSGLYDLITGDLGKVRDAFQQFVESDMFQGITKKISDALGNMYVSVKNVGKYIINQLGSLLGIPELLDVDKLDKNVAKISDILWNVAGAFKAIELYITSGKMLDTLKQLVVKGKEWLEPLVKVKDLIFEMVEDVRRLATELPKLDIFKKLFGEANSLLDNKRVTKGVLWTLLVGPGNVAGMLSGISIVMFGVTGTVMNFFRLLTASVATFKALWTAAWFAPLLKYTAIAAAVGGIIDLFKSGWTDSFFKSFLHGMLNVISEIVQYIAYKLSETFIGLRPFISRKAYVKGKYMEFASASDKLDLEKPASIEKIPDFSDRDTRQWLVDMYQLQTKLQESKEYMGFFAKLYNTKPNVLKNIDDIESVTTLRWLLDKMYVDTNIQEYLKEFPKLNTEHVTLKQEMDKNVFQKAENVIGDIFSSVTNLAADVEKLIGENTDDLLKIKTQLIDSLKPKVAKMEKPVDIENLTESGLLGTQHLLGLMESLGFDAKITSGYRTNSVHHKTGRAVDIQALNKPMMDEQLFTMFKVLKDKGIAEIVYAEQDKLHNMFERNTEIYKQYGLELKEADKSQGHYHVLFTENAKDFLSNVAALGSLHETIVAALSDAKSNLLKEIEDGKNELESFSPKAFIDPFADVTYMLKTIDNMEDAVDKVSQGINQSIKSMSNIVEEAFESLKKEEGHLFGPSMIKSLTTARDVYKKQRVELMEEVAKGFLDTRSETENIAFHVLGMLSGNSMVGKMRVPEGQEAAQLQLFTRGVGRGMSKFQLPLAPAAIDATAGIGQFIQSVKTAFTMAFQDAEFLQGINKDIATARRLSTEWLRDYITLNKQFEFAEVVPTAFMDSWSRQFDIAAMTEAINVTLHKYAEIGATQDEISNLISHSLQDYKSGVDLQEAFTNQLELQVKNLGVSKEQYGEITDYLMAAFNWLVKNKKETFILAKTTETNVKNIKSATYETLKQHRTLALMNRDRSVRESLGQRTAELVAKGEYYGGYGELFKEGIEEQVATFDTFAEIVLKSTKELADGMRQTFEDGFFDVMTQGVHSLSDMFVNLGNVVKNTITRIISQMLAISATKIVLGIDLNTGQMTGGGIGGILTRLVGGSFGSSSGGFLGNIFGTNNAPAAFLSKALDLSLTSMRTSNASQVAANAVQAAAGGGLVGNLGVGLMNIGGTAAAAKATGFKLSESWLGKTMKSGLEWLSTPTGLTSLGLGIFLSQPGRLFGGAKDNTGPAREQFASYEEQYTHYNLRRFEDATNYYMGNVVDILGHTFGYPRYWTHTSGDGFARGPKEIHGNVDPTAFIESLKEYYKRLFTAAEDHYNTMRKLNKMQETNSLAAVKEQEELERKKYDYLVTQYNYFVGANNFEKMDEYRDKVLEQRQTYLQQLDEVEKLTEETRYAEMRYLTYMKSSGEDLTAIAQTEIEILKMQMKKYTVNTLEWYNAQLELMKAEKDLADSLRDITRQLQDRLNDLLSSIYSLGQTSLDIYGRRTFDKTATEVYEMTARQKRLAEGNYSTDDLQAAGVFSGIRKGAKQNLVRSVLLDTGSFSLDELTSIYLDGLGYDALGIQQMPSSKKTRIDLYQSEEEVYYTYKGEEYKTIKEIIPQLTESLQNDIDRMIQDYTLDVQKLDIYKNISSLLNNVDDAITSRYEHLTGVLTNLTTDPYMEEEVKTTRKKQLAVDFATFYQDMASGISGWLKEGLFGKFDPDVIRFRFAVMENLDDVAIKYFNQLKLVAQKERSGARVLSTIRDMEDFSIFNEVIASDELKKFRGAIGNELGEISMYEDPYQAWYEYNKRQIETRIANAEANNPEEKSEEWWAANNDLLDLMIENAVRLKEKADKMNKSLEDLFERIEETIRMRVAEEHRTQKGDIIFMDVGASRDAHALLEKMIAAAKTNDPQAMALIEEFKKKMMGIR